MSATTARKQALRWRLDLRHLIPEFAVAGHVVATCEDDTCWNCGVIACPSGDYEHYCWDGCPSCGTGY